jgi:molybdenum cofactor biosynthesis enzyme MoaA
LPFPDHCAGCYCLSFASKAFFDKTEINVLQIEPSALCTLSCLACTSPEERRQIFKPPFNLSLELLGKVLNDLKCNGIRIRSIDFQGHGEPLMNPNIWEMIRKSANIFPNTFITMCTNAQGEYRPSEYQNTGLNEIQFAVDGVDQGSYQVYRRRGDFKKAIDFMGSFAETKVWTVWRYILFAHNDSAEHLKEVWEIAKRIGINELRFVFTHIGPKSKSILTPCTLRKMLLELGVTASKIRIDGGVDSMQRSRDIISVLKTFGPEVYAALRFCRRKLDDFLYKLADGPVVTCACFELPVKEIQRALNLAAKFIESGKQKEAAYLYLHAAKIAQRPANFDPEWDSNDILKDLHPDLDRIIMNYNACSSR